MMTSVAQRQAPPPVRDLLPEPGRYHHFKGGEYELLSVAEHTETGELLAVYRALDTPDLIWVRPLEMFVEQVERPDGVYPRFRPAASRRTNLLRRPRLLRLWKMLHRESRLPRGRLDSKHARTRSRTA